MKPSAIVGYMLQGRYDLLIRQIVDLLRRDYVDDNICYSGHEVCSSPDSLRVIKGGKKTQAEHVTRMGQLRNSYRNFLGNLKGKDRLGVISVHGRIRLKWISKIQDIRMWTGFIWLRIGTSGGLL
jgi:hypothetical protein